MLLQWASEGSREHKQNSCSLPLSVLAAFYAQSPPSSIALSPSFPWPFLLKGCSLPQLPCLHPWPLALHRHFLPPNPKPLDEGTSVGLYSCPPAPWPRWIGIGAWEPWHCSESEGGGGGGTRRWWTGRFQLGLILRHVTIVPLGAGALRELPAELCPTFPACCWCPLSPLI